MVEQTRVEQAKRELIETTEQLAMDASRVRQDIRFIAAVAGTVAIVLLSVPALRRRTIDLVRSLLNLTTLCDSGSMPRHPGGP